MENEIFKDIPGYEAEYQCSNLGRVKNKKTGQFKTPSQNRHNLIWNYKLSRGGVVSTFSCVKVVAMTWVKNPNPKLYNIATNIDGNPNNYRADNVKWATLSQAQLSKMERNPELKQRYKERFAAMAPLVSPSRKMTFELIEKLIEFRKKGYGVTQLEQFFPIKREQIRNILKANNVT